MQNCSKLMFGVMAILIFSQLCFASDDSVMTFAPLPIPEGVDVVTPAAQIRVPVRSWKTLRNARVVKQNLDYSCGAASLATLLNEFYGQSVTEQELLNAMDNEESRASFEDMQKALPQFGFRAQGYAASF